FTFTHLNAGRNLTWTTKGIASYTNNRETVYLSYLSSFRLNKDNVTQNCFLHTFAKTACSPDLFVNAPLNVSGLNDLMSCFTGPITGLSKEIGQVSQVCSQPF